MPALVENLQHRRAFVDDAGGRKGGWMRFGANKMQRFKKHRPCRNVPPNGSIGRYGETMWQRAARVLFKQPAVFKAW